MLSKKEYQENLIRMWDSLRDEAYKGATMCEGVICEDCPLCNKACGAFYIFEAIKIVEQWGKENQIVTNADKFKEVFGVEYDAMNSYINQGVKCRDCDYSEDGECDARNRFWSAEYKGR